jgi:CBS domain-containing protein
MQSFVFIYEKRYLQQATKSLLMSTVRNLLQSKGKHIFSVSPDITVYQALEIMLDKGIGAILIVENEKFVGIFTERDYARKLILKGKASKETLLREVMTENPITVTPDNTIEECMVQMSDRKFRHLPVMENGQLVGLISVGDLVKFIIEEQKYIIDNLQHYISQ